MRVLLADDHALVRRGMRALLEQQAGVSVVGEAADGIDAVALCEQHHPDVVVAVGAVEGSIELVAKSRRDGVVLVWPAQHEVAYRTVILDPDRCSHRHRLVGPPARCLAEHARGRTCEQTGIISCSTCDGAGLMDCVRCGGDGRRWAAPAEA